MTYMATRVSGFGTTVFTEMTALANKHNAINLGQGFPDFAAPDFLKEAARQAIAADINQYAPGNGRSRLRQALSQKMQRHYGMTVDPDTEITVLHGATEAIFATIIGLVNLGDEVILFEPFYDSYAPSTIMAGGVVRAYTLRPPDWQIDREALAALFTDKTKLIVVNTPHNPTGKVFSQAELTMIAELCREHDVIAVTDEVYEHLVYNGRSHHPLATFPDMAERTVTISSLGKTFSATGWKVGWTIAKPELNQADIREFGFPDDVAFCRYLTTEVGVAAIPPGAFYANPADGASLARFAFCKSDATLEEAAKRLQKLKKSIHTAIITPL